MCGIFGIVSNTKPVNSFRNQVEVAISSLSHRGPDNSGIIEFDQVILAHSRLSIIDLEHGNQPMVSLDGNRWIVFNGEIFNYKSLRKELIQLGYAFNGYSDTEVILVAYEHYGKDCVNYFQGMFAFTIYDLNSKELFAARDRYGLKPFYYSLYNDLFIFGSEAQAFYEGNLIPFENKAEHFNEFLIFGYVSGRETLHKYIFELENGHSLTFKDGRINVTQYYEYTGESQKLEKASEKELIYEIDNKIKDSVKLWSTADVEVSTLLSGGVDSSLITYFASKQFKQLKTFTIHFPNDTSTDERSLSKTTSSLIECQSFYSTLVEKDVLEQLHKIYCHYEEPLPSSSFTLYNLCKKIRDISNLKVVLSGDGADEIFGGYLRHRTILEEYRMNNNDKIIYYSMNKFALPRLELFSENTEITNSARINELNTLKSKSDLNKILELDQKLYLAPYLHQLDRVGMMFGLEIRSPFLEHTLTEFVNQLPEKYKIQGNTHKYILRKVAEKYLDSKVVWNRKKTPFSSPMINRMFFNGGLANLYKEVITKKSKIASYFDIQGMRKLLKMHNPHEEYQDHSNTLFRILTLEMWLNSRRNIT